MVSALKLYANDIGTSVAKLLVPVLSLSHSNDDLLHMGNCAEWNEFAAVGTVPSLEIVDYDLAVVIRSISESRAERSEA